MKRTETKRSAILQLAPFAEYDHTFSEFGKLLKSSLLCKYNCKKEKSKRQETVSIVFYRQQPLKVISQQSRISSPLTT